MPRGSRLNHTTRGACDDGQEDSRARARARHSARTDGRRDLVAARSTAADAGPFLAFDRAAVDKITIDGDGKSITLVKADDTWTLPSEQGLPADAQKVNEMLDKLSSPGESWPGRDHRFGSENVSRSRKKSSSGGSGSRTAILRLSISISARHPASARSMRDSRGRATCMRSLSPTTMRRRSRRTGSRKR